MQLKENVARIKQLLAEKKEATHALCRFLVSKGVCRKIAQKVVVELSCQEQRIEHLPPLLARFLPTAPDFSLKAPLTLALVGPCGVGKTTLAQKIIAHFEKKGKKAALYPADASLFDLQIVDTPGALFYRAGGIDALGQQLAGIESAVEVILVLSGAAKEVDLIGAVYQFSPLCPSSLALTRLDETLNLGTLINFGARKPPPIRYWSEAEKGLVVAEATALAREILLAMNTLSLQKLRQTISLEN